MFINPACFTHQLFATRRERHPGLTFLIARVVQMLPHDLNLTPQRLTQKRQHVILRRQYASIFFELCTLFAQIVIAVGQIIVPLRHHGKFFLCLILPFLVALIPGRLHWPALLQIIFHTTSKIRIQE